MKKQENDNLTAEKIPPEIKIRDWESDGRYNQFVEPTPVSFEERILYQKLKTAFLKMKDILRRPFNH